MKKINNSKQTEKDESVLVAPLEVETVEAQPEPASLTLAPLPESDSVAFSIVQEKGVYHLVAIRFNKSTLLVEQPQIVYSNSNQMDVEEEFKIAAAQEFFE